MRWGPLNGVLLAQQPLSPQQPCREQHEASICNIVCRDKFVHKPIVGRPAHPLWLVRVSC
jgi:hypothetical protein